MANKILEEEYDHWSATDIKRDIEEALDCAFQPEGIKVVIKVTVEFVDDDQSNFQ